MVKFVIKILPVVCFIISHTNINYNLLLFLLSENVLIRNVFTFNIYTSVNLVKLLHKTLHNGNNLLSGSAYKPWLNITEVEQ